MRVLKEADKNSVVALDVVTYKITVTNDSRVSIVNVIITDNIPECTSFIDGSVELDGVPISDGDIEQGIRIDIIPAGNSAIITFKVQVEEDCNNCNIANVACVKYLLNGINYSELSNVLVIPKDCGQNTNTCNSLSNKYVVPGPGTQSKTEIVILTDEESTGGVMTLPGNTLALSSEAVKLLKKAFIEQYPSKVSDLNPTNNYDISALLVSLNNAGIISFSENPPSQEEILRYNVAEGELINRPSANCTCEVILQPIVAQYAGRVICIGIGSWIRVYIYISIVSLPDIDCKATTSTAYEGIGTFGPLGYTIYPEPISGTIGSGCGACGTCGLCTGCALCGPSAILGAASAAALSALSLISLSILANTNMPQ